MPHNVDIGADLGTRGCNTSCKNDFNTFTDQKKHIVDFASFDVTKECMLMDKNVADLAENLHNARNDVRDVKKDIAKSMQVMLEAENK